MNQKLPALRVTQAAITNLIQPIYILECKYREGKSAFKVSLPFRCGNFSIRQYLEAGGGTIRAAPSLCYCLLI